MSTATDTAPEPPQEGGGKPRFFSRLVKAGASSVVATGVSQVTLIGLLAVGASPTLASSVAFVAGAVPNFFLYRNWAWGRKGKPQVKRELVPYLCVIGIGALASVGLTTVAGWITEPLEISGFTRIIVLDIAYLTSYALVFILKFTLLDRLVFGNQRELAPAPAKAA